MSQCFIPLRDFSKSPYSKILGYPKATKRQIDSRINELKKLKITEVSFEGSTKLDTLNILGKGYVGVVVLAKLNRTVVALKIRRTDSQRKNMKNEAKLLKIANRVGVGPKLIAVSNNFLVMEYLSGLKIGEWMEQISGKGSVKSIKNVIRKVLDDCYNIDKIGLDHGELSSISKHVIVGKKITLIDFESSSTQRKVSNVTSATQGIHIGSGIAKKISKFYKISSKDILISNLRNYKQKQTKQSFDEILRSLKLENVSE